MSEYIGIDTSNYTTSVAVYISQDKRVIQKKRLLPVRDGELGLRQSDAVFHHTKQLPELIGLICNDYKLSNVEAIAASVRPRNLEGSYMPCFLVGEGYSKAYSALTGIRYYETSHQIGHILAALYSADKLDLVNERFIAFHVSGGTTDCLMCEPSSDDVLRVTELATSLDLKAGQAVDRAGIMLGLKFPCGPELESLAIRSDKTYKVKPVIKDGSCCLSGVENKCAEMLRNGEKAENIARFCLDFLSETILAMTECAIKKHGNLPIIFAGGVMSDKLIRDRIISQYPNAYFARPEFSCDNATGIAIFGYLKQAGDELCL